MIIVDFGLHARAFRNFLLDTPRRLQSSLQTRCAFEVERAQLERKERASISRSRLRRVLARSRTQCKGRKRERCSLRERRQDARIGR